MELNTRTEESYALLRAQILDGSLAPGSRLVQEDLARQLGLSRVPLREAIRKLEGERLVVVSPRRGVTIPDLTDEDIVDLYSIRIRIEPWALRGAAEVASEGQLADLSEKTDALQGLLEDPQKFFLAHDDVVRSTIAMSPGQVLADIVTSLRERSQHLRFAYSQLPGQTAKLLEARRRIMGALAARESDLVEQLACIDLIEGRNALLAWRRSQSSDVAQ